MPSWPATIDENRVRLRASCNACNESKVRCSQQKPTCARCERTKIECVYGLSRRTHKDAPPISSLPSQRGRRVSSSGRPTRVQLPSNSDNSTSTTSSSISNNATPSNDANLFDEYMFPTVTGADSPPMHRAVQPSPLDFGSLINASGASTNSNGSTAMARLGVEYTHANPWVLSTDMATFWARSSEGECTCHADVPELLASMRSSSCSSSSNDQWLSLDAQLAKLKQCIASSETSMGCTHGREDSEPIHIMAVAMLIGYVIDGFKTLASKSSLRRSSPSWSSSWSATTAAGEMATLGNGESGMSESGVATPNSSNNMTSLGGLMEPRLSWGALELEENDEMDLRQRLYLLSFRKLERLLSQLTLYLQDLRNVSVSLPDSSQHMAFVIACDYTRLWLEKKASDVKKLFSVLSRDETMNSGLA
ncbi:MAG: hypothetical protein M1822_007292 [Bathelium mastoideum]|nr:MAG: hypothetical protein M1822_007292 [Bathelium mastoideum]